jgi:hypothetical protein
VVSLIAAASADGSIDERAARRARGRIRWYAAMDRPPRSSTISRRPPAARCVRRRERRSRPRPTTTASDSDDGPSDRPSPGGAS